MFLLLYPNYGLGVMTKEQLSSLDLCNCNNRKEQERIPDRREECKASQSQGVILYAASWHNSFSLKGQIRKMNISLLVAAN